MPFLLLVACQSGAEGNNQMAAAPAVNADPAIAAAEGLVRQQVGERGELSFVAGERKSLDGVTVVCGAYKQSGARQNYIVVNGEDVFVEPEMQAGEMPRAIAEFCGDSGRA